MNKNHIKLIDDFLCKNDKLSPFFDLEHWPVMAKRFDLFGIRIMKEKLIHG